MSGRRDESIDRLPPHSLEDEQGALGCCLLDSEKVDEVVERGGADLFYDRRHQVIFAALHRLLDTGKPIDMVTVVGALKDGDALQNVGGPVYLSELMDCVPSALNLPVYLERLIDLRRLRVAIAVCSEAVGAAYAAGARSEGVINRLEGGLMRLVDEHSQKTEVKLKELLPGVIERVERYHRGRGQISGLPTGFEYLDKMTGGLQAGRFNVFAARPGVGKTTLGMNIAEHLTVVCNVPVGFFSLEMPNDELAERLVFSHARANVQKFRTGYSEDKDLPRIVTTLGKVDGAPLWLDDSSGLNILQLRSRARRMVRMHGVKAIFVDYLGLMSGTNPRQDRIQALREATNGMKSLAKELNIPVTALAQINRESMKGGMDGKPGLHHLKDSGTIEEDADLVLMLWETKENRKLREEYEAELPASLRWDSKIQKVTVTVAKQRGGETGDTYLDFFKTCTRFQHTKFGVFNPEEMVLSAGEESHVEEI